MKESPHFCPFPWPNQKCKQGIGHLLLARHTNAIISLSPGPCKAGLLSPLTGRETESWPGQETCFDHTANSRAGSLMGPKPLLHSHPQPNGPSLQKGPTVRGLLHRPSQSRGLSSSRNPAANQPPAQPAPAPLALEAGTSGLQTQGKPVLNGHTQPTWQRMGDPEQELPAKSEPGPGRTEFPGCQLQV